MTRPAVRRVMLACFALAFVCPACAEASRPLALGFLDSAFTASDGATWLGRASTAGAGIVRIDVGWPVANTPSRPAGFNAQNPADPHYDFSHADSAIRAASHLGLRVLVSFTGAPQWAEGPRRPASVPQGTWRPDPQALEDYGAALARRYSGHFPDPANPGQMLPRVEAFQPWNEPNLNAYLNPQWSGSTPAAPTIYRAMLNGFYRGVKSVDPHALVVTAGTAPFGDPQSGGARLQPALFWRGVLCVRQAHKGGGLHHARCPDPPHFDVFAHHPYAWGSPTQHALWPDDVAIPDMGKLSRILRYAERTGGALPHIHHPVWVTEIGYNSKPPNRHGLPLAKQARWLEETFAELWRERVSTVIWFQVGDEPGSGPYSQDSGVFFQDGRPKPSLTAYRFPLVVWPAKGGSMQVWARPPSSGQLQIQEQTRSGWKTVRTLHAASGATVTTAIPPFSGGVRGVVSGQTSLTWAS